MTIADRIYETVKNLPEQQAAEVLDFAEFLQSKSPKSSLEKRQKALATLDKHRGLFKAGEFNRDELYDR